VFESALGGYRSFGHQFALATLKRRVTATRERNDFVTIPTIEGRSGFTVPAIGLGTYSLDGNAGTDAMIKAIGLGYRLLDSAFNYENEGAVGAAVRRSSVARDELLVTSKLPGRHHRYADAITTIEESVLRTGLDYLDIYLIHWPNPLEDHYVEAWRALIESRDRGLVRYIGVSNFLPEHLERLREETGELPALNQIELHPYFPQTEQLAYHAANGIVTESWSPLGRGTDLLSNPVIVAVAAEHDVTPAQAILAWHVRVGALPIPKSKSLERQRENLDVFEVALTDEDMERIGSLARPDGRVANQDPSVYQEF
jgi:diketogulonate reductase-like aldo/keto reductase